VSRPVRLTLDREEIATLIWALDDLVETYKVDGGLSLIEEEMRVRDKLQDRLERFDGSGKYRAASRVEK
jgi:hypothetical protein